MNQTRWTRFMPALALTLAGASMAVSPAAAQQRYCDGRLMADVTVQYRPTTGGGLMGDYAVLLRAQSGFVRYQISVDHDLPAGGGIHFNHAGSVIAGHALPLRIGSLPIASPEGTGVQDVQRALRINCTT
ncbi:hypothetical protein J8J14_02700 [Roseomonas sp. SSH11]|uniref:Uncharacterized protein n=1 Tax=Pararoseomonas baculiformis TaxID=2820812 RepID=A0ABS4A9J5_9PROT|nr:hypothetical protein [Pararoseomonas baculiformis]MBP0443676.1 hypothetical protein [Pararoseomonas baculiformis]